MALDGMSVRCCPLKPLSVTLQAPGRPSRSSHGDENGSAGGRDAVCESRRDLNLYEGASLRNRGGAAKLRGGQFSAQAGYVHDGCLVSGSDFGVRGTRMASDAPASV